MRDSLLYFAYGSNMLSRRLAGRCPSAAAVGRARLAGHRLRFDKRSWRDGSGKCHVVADAAAGAAVWGVLYRVPEAELGELDRMEGVGKGYEVGVCRVRGPRDRELPALTYLAEAGAVDESLRPFSWYRDLVVAGAVEHALPEEWIATLRAVEVVEDTRKERRHAMRELLSEEPRP
ncbi:MAG: gamma-glutamylcyclotransferase family protein [Thermoanaerobaculia bacterium]